MANKRVNPVLTLGLCLGVLTGCSRQEPASLDEALALYRENKLEQALPLFERLVAQDKENAETHAWLAETYRRLGEKDEAVKTARRALEIDPCNSFAHTVIAEASNPLVGVWEKSDSDTTWVHLMKAGQCDSTNGNPWLLTWGEAIHRGDLEMMRKSLAAMVETGFLTKAALAYGRWMLRGLPENAILLTNGDMDTYPPCAVQEAEGFRTDVVVVNRGLLSKEWFARFIRDHRGVELPFDDAQLEGLAAHKGPHGNLVSPSDQIFRGWADQKAQGLLDRPLAVAVTVEESYFSEIKDNLRYAGAFMLWHDGTANGTPDTTSMRASLSGVGTHDFAGPWVSEQDRSPIRRLYTKNVVRNVTATALTYTEQLIEAKRLSEAGRWVNWTEEVERNTELGPVSTERVAQLKGALSKMPQ